MLPGRSLRELETLCAEKQREDGKTRYIIRISYIIKPTLENDPEGFEYVTLGSNQPLTREDLLEWLKDHGF